MDVGEDGSHDPFVARSVWRRIEGAKVDPSRIG
jgi:hypothetical protein